MNFETFYDNLLFWGLNNLLFLGLIVLLILMCIAKWRSYENAQVLPFLFTTGLFYAPLYQSMSIPATVDQDIFAWSLRITCAFLCGPIMGVISALLCKAYIFLSWDILSIICSNYSKKLDGMMKYVRNTDGSQLLEEYGLPMENDLLHFTFFETCRFVVQVLLWIGGICLGFIVLWNVIGYLLIVRF